MLEVVRILDVPTTSSLSIQLFLNISKYAKIKKGGRYIC